MPKEGWGFLTEKAFKAALQASVPERLPDKVAAVTPWKRAMGRVLAGMALTGTNLWGLNYPLPGIGLVLMLLGFRLLRREEIKACRGAIQVVVSVQEFDQEGGFCRSSGSNPLCITGVGGKLTGEPASWMIFRHFLWDTAPPFHGTAAIQLWPVYQSDELWSAAGEVAGRVLYDRDGETFWAPYHSLEEDTSPLRISGHLWTAGHFRDIFSVHCGAARAGLCGMPPMKFLTQNTEMCWIAGSITAIRTDFCNTRQKRHWKTGCPIMGHFGPSGAICATTPK